MEQQTTLPEYLKRVEKELPVIYILSIFAAAMHFIVGITWEQVPISNIHIRLQVPYLGGILILVAVGFLLVTVYLWLTLRQEAELPLYKKRFRITLCILMSLVQSALGVILPLRAHDYRISQSQISGGQYSGLMMVTVIDILLTFVTIPHFVYLLYVNCKNVRLTAKQEEKTQQQPSIDERNDVSVSPSPLRPDPLPRRSIVLHSSRKSQQREESPERRPKVEQEGQTQFELMRISARSYSQNNEHQRQVQHEDPQRDVSIRNDQPDA